MHCFRPRGVFVILFCLKLHSHRTYTAPVEQQLTRLKCMHALTVSLLRIIARITKLSLPEEERQ